MLLSEGGFELVENLARQTDIPSLLACFQRLVLAHGMDCFCIGDPSHPEVRRDDRRWGATWPVYWYCHYIEQNHLAHDPVIARLNRSPAPFRWSDTFAGAGRKGRLVLEEAAEFGLDGRAGAGGPGRRRTRRDLHRRAASLNCRRASRLACSLPPITSMPGSRPCAPSARAGQSPT